jgi:hypothetical protein
MKTKSLVLLSSDMKKNAMLWSEALYVNDIPVKSFRRIRAPDPVVCDCCSKLIYPTNPNDRGFQWLPYGATLDDPYVKQLFCGSCLMHFGVNECPCFDTSQVKVYSRFKYDDSSFYPTDRKYKMTDTERGEAVQRFFGPDPAPGAVFTPKEFKSPKKRCRVDSSAN